VPGNVKSRKPDDTNYGNGNRGCAIARLGLIPKSRRWINHETHEKKSKRGSSGVWLCVHPAGEIAGQKKSFGFRVISCLSWFQSRFVG
jgi:hypothetical protein